MFKGAKLFSMLLLFLLFTIGCSSREEVTVSTYDEKIEELERPILPFIINQDGKTICANNWSATVSPNVK